MPHATRADMEARYGAAEMDALDRAGGFEAALADASAEIDAALAAAYGAPAPGAHPALRGIACDLARERMYDDAAPETATLRAGGARERLRRLAAGEESLVDAAGVPAPRRAAARWSGPAPAMRGP